MHTYLVAMVATGRQSLEVTMVTDLYLPVIAARWGNEQNGEQTVFDRDMVSVLSVILKGKSFLYIIRCNKRIDISKCIFNCGH